MNTPPIRILCVDDNELVRQALERKFKGLPGFQWCGTLTDAQDLVERVRACRADVVLLDLDMPGPEPLAQARALARAVPACRVVVLSGMLTESLVSRAIEAGAWGYLSKAEASEEIIDAVRRVAAGEVVLSREVSMVFTRPIAPARAR